MARKQIWGKIKELLSETVPLRRVSLCRYSAHNRLEISYAQGISDKPLLGITIGKQLQKKVDEHPDKEAAVFKKERERLTFAQLLDRADQLAAGLLQLGLKKGDRVGIWGPNTREWLLTQYATARAGLILVNVNPLYKQRELEYALKKVGCKVLIAAERFQDNDYYETLFRMIPELIKDKPGDIHSHLLPDLKIIIMLGKETYRGTFRFDDILSAATDKDMRSIKDLQKQLQFDEPINIQFTSGTTGIPKGATLTHHNILNNSYFTGITLDYHKRETRICLPVPLYHCFGMVLGSLCMATHGATCIFPGPWFNAKDTLDACSEERCTALYGVPTMFIDILNQPNLSHLDLSSLYTGIMAGSPCPVEIMKQVIERMNMKNVTICYGSTETSPVTFQSSMFDTVEKRVSTIGSPHPMVEAKIVDENSNVVEVGSPGELWTRGYTTMLKYWNDPDKTNEVIAPGFWYKTGDIAVMDDEGYCKIIGRIKDLIIRGGENVYPVEVEQIIYEHPKVKDVQVIGVPDDRLGEEIAAWIQLKEGQEATVEDIKQHCLEHLAKFKVPKYIEFVDEYPMTMTGKVQKVKIREQAATKLHLEHVRPH